MLGRGATHLARLKQILCSLDLNRQELTLRGRQPLRVPRAEPPLGAAIRGEPSSVVDAQSGLFCWVGGVAKALVTAAVQPVIKHERQGRGDRPGPYAGLCPARVWR